MLSILEVLLLGLIQGITEWLPISSSGHLVVVQQFLKINVTVFFDVMLHVGTLIAVVSFFRKDIYKILKALVKLDFKSSDGKLIIYIVLGTIPTAIIGIVFQRIFESFFSNTLVVGIAFLVTGVILLSAKFKSGEKELNYIYAFLIGIIQGIAIIPGISRSGSTIAIGLLLGVRKEAAAKFSFILSIPAIIGASAVEAMDLISVNLELSEILFTVIGVLVAAVVGYLSIRFLLNIIFKRKFHLFSFYCYIIGITVLIISLSAII